MKSSARRKGASVLGYAVLVGALVAAAPGGGIENVEVVPSCPTLEWSGIAVQVCASDLWDCLAGTMVVFDGPDGLHQEYPGPPSPEGYAKTCHSCVSAKCINCTPGTYRLVARAANYREAQLTVVVPASGDVCIPSKEVAVNIRLEPK